MKNWLLIFLLLSGTPAIAQEMVCARTAPDDSSRIFVKWYRKALVNGDTYLIFRQQKVDRKWERVNQQPVAYRQRRITAAEKNADEELNAYAELASRPANFKSIALIAVLVKSFSSVPLCRYLGIIADDTTARPGLEYRYKVMAQHGATEIEVGVSGWLLAGRRFAEAAPREFSIREHKKKVQLRWLPEPLRYYGVNVYRRVSDTGSWNCITPKPMMLSQIKNGKGDLVFPDFLYEDHNLPTKVPVSYRIEGLDFFGQATEMSREITVTLADEEPPAPVDSLKVFADGLKIFLKWVKTYEDQDLSGFNVYRTNRNDTDYARVNSSLIEKSECRFSDSVVLPGPYFYKVSCVDYDGNEAFTNAHFVESYDNIPPAKPLHLEVKGDTGRMYLTWWKGKEKDIRGYVIYRTIDHDDSDAYVKITPRPVECCSYTDRMNSRGRNKFMYKIAAMDSSLNRSEYSAAAGARMPDVTGPSAPFLIYARLNAQSAVELEWMSNPEPDLESYEVFRKQIDDKTAVFQKISKGTLSPAILKFVDRSLVVSGGSYAYRIVAVDSAGNRSQPSNDHKIKVNTKAQEQLIAPRLQAHYQKRKKSVTLKWSAGPEDLLGYVVYRSDSSGKGFEALTGFLRDEYHTDKKLNKDDTYVYQVRAYSSRGNVAHSNNIKILIKRQ